MDARRLRLRLRILPENQAAKIADLMINAIAQVMTSLFLFIGLLKPPPKHTSM